MYQIDNGQLTVDNGQWTVDNATVVGCLTSWKTTGIPGFQGLAMEMLVFSFLIISLGLMWMVCFQVLFVLVFFPTGGQHAPDFEKVGVNICRIFGK